MSAHETRLLLLGAVAMFEPINGCQIRRELVSWEVDKWAHVNPGSIYHVLAKLTEQGHLVRHELRDGTRDVSVYELTAQGRDELATLLRSSLETVDPYDAVAFHAAFSMLPLLGREEVLAALEVRRRGLEETIARCSARCSSPSDAPSRASTATSSRSWCPGCWCSSACSARSSPASAPSPSGARVSSRPSGHPCQPYGPALRPAAARPAQLLVQALILVAFGYVMGMRGSVGGVAVGIVLTLLIGGACAAASNALALTTKSEDVMAPLINMVMMPVLLLSGILLPMTLGPAWLQTTRDFMPFRWIVDGVRDAFTGDLGTSGVLWGTAVFRRDDACR